MLPRRLHCVDPVSPRPTFQEPTVTFSGSGLLMASSRTHSPVLSRFLPAGVRLP